MPIPDGNSVWNSDQEFRMGMQGGNSGCENILGAQDSNAGLESKFGTQGKGLHNSSLDLQFGVENQGIGYARSGKPLSVGTQS